ncbi:hypothetical protein [Bradyrhizobium sp. CB3481]|uniref:hypothetical protein n=1 Tax=Bradyrhizobium sp. CB3481 TaxID=3039158 RepID=UPI0024B1E78C|nr:hypothetical protein [Bradyrhizobium sp. CB3481]WFU16588.1 hypothetical protein QA643_37580 [Bradyrhizobium sp. CB3481]
MAVATGADTAAVIVVAVIVVAVTGTISAGGITAAIFTPDPHTADFQRTARSRRSA